MEVPTSTTYVSRNNVNRIRKTWTLLNIFPDNYRNLIIVPNNTLNFFFRATSFCHLIFFILITICQLFPVLLLFFLHISLALVFSEFSIFLYYILFRDPFRFLQFKIFRNFFSFVLYSSFSDVWLMFFSSLLGHIFLSF